MIEKAHDDILKDIKQKLELQSEGKETGGICFDTEEEYSSFVSQLASHFEKCNTPCPIDLFGCVKSSDHSGRHRCEDGHNWDIPD